MMTDKRKMRLWAKRLHIAFRAYHELLMNIVSMSCQRDQTMQSAARILKSNIFYQPEFRDMLPIHLHRFSRAKFSVDYLKDLVETNHVYLKLLEDFTKVHSKIVIQKKIRSKKQKKKRDTKKETEESRQTRLEEEWGTLSGIFPQVFEGISESELEDVIPFDLLLTEEEEKKADAIKRMQSALRKVDSGGCLEALSLLRSVRLLITDGTFGPPEVKMTSDDEVRLLREMFFANIGTHAEEEEAKESDKEDEDSEEEEEMNERVVEKELEFKDFVVRYANAKVVENYSFLLKSYEQNSAHTNHCIVKMFHRLAFDSGLAPVLNCGAALRLRAEYLEKSCLHGVGFDLVPDAKFFGEGFGFSTDKTTLKERKKLLKRMEREKKYQERKARKVSDKTKQNKSAKATVKKSTTFKSSEFIDSNDSSSDDESALQRILGRAAGVEATTHADEERDEIFGKTSADVERLSSVSSNESSSDDVDSDRKAGNSRVGERSRNKEAWKRARRLMYSNSDDEAQLILDSSAKSGNLDEEKDSTDDEGENEASSESRRKIADKAPKPVIGADPFDALMKASKSPTSSGRVRNSSSSEGEVRVVPNDDEDDETSRSPMRKRRRTVLSSDEEDEVNEPRDDGGEKLSTVIGDEESNDSDDDDVVGFRRKSRMRVESDSD
ncbi:unnamed protein product [Notodromas monacha]|uniref:Uncharacterized protein n=1 Tax=Notodromas monacha TaxID=399045 RepID=A0A7R9BNY2_9CRUS|nr:unnamed protein product [Notodromas monacha]CAG0919004.1 unnamed protein product [Notodromas monacha]